MPLTQNCSNDSLYRGPNARAGAIRLNGARFFSYPVIRELPDPRTVQHPAQIHGNPERVAV